MPVFLRSPVDNKSVQIEMARVKDFAGDLALSEWARLLKEESEQLTLLANVHEAMPTATTKEAVVSALDSIQGLLSGAHRSIDAGERP